MEKLENEQQQQWYQKLEVETEVETIKQTKNDDDAPADVVEVIDIPEQGINPARNQVVLPQEFSLGRSQCPSNSFVSIAICEYFIS